MELPLEGRRSRVVLLIVSLAIATTLIWQASRFWLARHRMESGQILQLESSAALVPTNGEVWDQLGRLHQWDLVDGNLSLALEDFRRAVEVDPLSAHYWIDLAGALEASGDEAGARNAFERAQSVYPKSAEVAFTYGNFLLRHADSANGYRELRRAAEGDARLLPLVISRAWRSTEDIGQFLDQVLPQDPNAYLQALDYFRATHQADPALVVWGRLIMTGAHFPLRGSFPLMDELIDDDRSIDARRVWREAITAAGLPYSAPANQSLVWNGNFRADFANGGLDWRRWPVAGAIMDFDSEPGPNGSGVVRLDFSGGANPDLPVPFEFVPVEPGRAYRFHAYLRTEQITTESGVRFQLSDPNHANSLNLVTDNFIGSHRWSTVDVDFTAGPEEHFLVIRLVRYASRLFDNKLGGTAWIADVSVIQANGSPSSSTP